MNIWIKVEYYLKVLIYNLKALVLRCKQILVHKPYKQILLQQKEKINYWILKKIQRYLKALTFKKNNLKRQYEW